MSIRLVKISLGLVFGLFAGCAASAFNKDDSTSVEDERTLKDNNLLSLDVINNELNKADKALKNENIDLAISIAQKYAKKGNARAQYLLGRYSYMKFYIENYGKGINRKIREKENQANQNALKWMTKSAEQGYAPAQIGLGSIYMEEGRGVTVDYVLGLMWIILGVSQGNDKSSLESAISQAISNYSLTQEDINDAKRMANEWRLKK